MQSRSKLSFIKIYALHAFVLFFCFLSFVDKSNGESGRIENERQQSLQSNELPLSSPFSSNTESPVKALNTRDPWEDETTIPPPQIKFCGKRTTNFSSDAAASPLSTLMLILGEDFFKNLVEPTNHYASSFHERSKRLAARKLVPITHVRKWTDVDEKELKKFFGLLFAMSLNPKPTQDFWSTKSFLQCPFFGATMSRDRFMQILKFLHLVDNNTLTDRAKRQDKLYKIRPVINLLLSQFKALYQPGKQLSVGESMCVYEGQVNFGSNNPVKPHKFRMKLYRVYDGVTGYCCKFKVARQELIVNKWLVFDLLHDHLGKGHEVYLDRRYTTVSLFRELFAKKTVAVGKCMQFRNGLPKDLISQKLQKGNVVARRQGPLMALKWCAEDEVLMLSTKHSSAVENVKVKPRSNPLLKQKPVVVIEYAKYMPRVDMSDQMMRYHSFNKKTDYWWKKLFFHLMNLALVNAQKLYNLCKVEEGQKTMSLFNFVSSIVDDLTKVNDASSNVKFSRFVHPQYRHFPEHISDERSDQQICEHCKNEYEKNNTTDEEGDGSSNSNTLPKRPRRSAYQCSLCKVALCIDKCFTAYHSK